MKPFKYALLVIVMFSMPDLILGQAITLGTVSDFVLFSSIGAVTNTGTSHYTGNIGTNSGAISGFGNINGTMHTGDGVSALCSIDLLSAYNQLDTATPTFFPSATIGNGDTILAGVYYLSSSSTLNANLILNALGNTNAVFIFQIQGTFSTNASSGIILINGAQACNVYWKVEGMISMAAGTTMRGTLIANNAAINMAIGDTLEGRVLSTDGAVSVNGVIAFTPAGCGSPILTGPAAPALASTACYALFSSSGAVSNSGATYVTGDVGTNAGLTTGYDSLLVTGTIHPIPDGSTATCNSDLSNLYTYLDTLPYDIELLYPSLFGNNLTLTPHVYFLNSATIFTDTLFLDAEGNTGAVFVIQVNGAFSTAAYSNVRLVNGAQGKNVFWIVVGSVTIGNNSVFNGTIVSNAAIILDSRTTLNGRALTTSGALTTTANTVTANLFPYAGIIIGASTVCAGSMITLTDSIAGGTWSSSNTSVNIGSLSGIVSGTAADLDTIIYTVSNACGSVTTSKSLTVNPTFTAAPTNNGPLCLGGAVNLIASVTGDTGTLFYAWAGPGLSSSTLANPIAIPTVTGIYIYSLSVSSAGPICGSGTVYTTTMTINQIPLSTGPTNTSPICIGGSAILNANSSNATGWLWTGPGGFSSTAQNPATSPVVTSTFSLTVNSIGINCSPSNVYTTTVTVNATPVASPNNNGPICGGNSVLLTANPSGGANIFSWSGANLSSTTAQNPTATPSVTAVYSLTVTDSSGGSGCGPVAIYTTTVIVNPGPLASPSNNGPVCKGGNVTLYANLMAGITSFTWTGPGLSPTTSPNPTVSPTVTGTYSLTVTSSLGSGYSPVIIYTTVVTVWPVPAASPSNTGPICTGGTVTLQSNPSNGSIAYSWTGPNLSNSSRQNPTATPTVTSTYSLTVTNGSGLQGCSPANVYTTTVIVNPVPSAAPTSSGTLCNGGSVTLMANPSGGANIYLWSGSGLTNNTSQNPSATPTVTTTYHLTVSSGPGTSCNPSTSYSTTVTVIAVPAASPTNNGPVCEGNSVTLLANPSAGANTYSWSGPGLSASTVASPIVSPSVTTVYSLTVTNGSGLSGCSPATVYTTMVTVNPLPSPIMGTVQSCIASTSTLSASTYGGSWTSGDTGIASVVGSTGVVTGISAGTTVITYTLVTGCVAIILFTVIPNPLAVTVATGGTSCGSATITASGGSGGTIYYQGTTPGGLSTAVPSSSQVVTASGTYYFRSLSSSGCWGTQGSLPVNIPVISGISLVCLSGFATLSQTEGSGTWTSSSPSVSSIGSTTGIYTGVSIGSAIITFTPSSGCTLTTNINVISALPPITGPSAVCVGQTITLADLVPGGIWSSSSPTIATVLTNTGIVTGYAGGMGVTISYALGAGCAVTYAVSVNAFSAIAGASSVCSGQTLSLTDATWGGTWSSSDSVVGNIDPSFGVVTGVSVGTTIITYILPSGCTATSALTVNPLSAITGPSSVCLGQVVTLSDATAGGTWASSQPTIASIGAGTGIITGIAGGLSSVISYTLSSGCFSTATLNVNNFSGIAGATSVCKGQSIILTDATSGGSWTTSDSTIATIASSSGNITGVSVGNIIITYTVPSGCKAIYPVSVNPLSAITGTSVVCTGQTIILSDTILGGTWTSGAPTEASVGATTGIVTGAAGGFSPTITYTLGTGCKAVFVVTVNPLAGISGASLFCQGTTQTLGNTNSGGNWSSSNIGVANVTTSGYVTGISAGTAAISYTLPTGCTAYQVEVIQPVTYPIGSSSVCVGLNTLLSETTTPGTWVSSNTSVATVGTYSGLVSGISQGTAVISYKITSTGCRAMDTIMVRISPGTISGAASICSGATTSYSNTSEFGNWSSNNTSIATIGTVSGVVTGVASGTAILTYNTGCGCNTYVTQVITIGNSAITGSLVLCNGGTTILSDASTGGTWASSNTAVATIGPGTGMVSAVSAGTTTISYSNSGCTSGATLMVTDIPGAISGNAAVCPGAISALSNPIPYGTWSTSDTTVATIDSTLGLLTGIASGTCTITYSTGCGSVALITATVNLMPSAISASGNICIGSSVTLSESGAGTWTSGNPAVATIDVSLGIVSGISIGTTIITFSTGSGCLATATETINSPLSSISGNASVCPGTNSTLTETSAGTWSSSVTGIATINDSSGIMTGVSAGTTTITYSASGGCNATIVATVNPLPSSISGSTGVCIGTNVTFVDAGGGTWSSSDISKASIGSSTGVVTGVGIGTVDITYALGSGCITYLQATVNPLPSGISGVASACLGFGSTLSDAGSGTWSSSNSGVATIDPASGIIASLTVGTTIITYTLGTGCKSTKIFTINGLPSDISGIASVCTGSNTLLSDSSVGTWSSSSGTIAIVGSLTGIVIGVSPGTVNITYTLSAGCAASALVTVKPLPSAISGLLGLCNGSSLNLTDGGGGTWTSANTAIATISSTSGLVSGISPGTTLITYVLGTGCQATAVLTVNPLPAAIGGIISLAIAGTSTLSEATGGGIWTSNNTAIAIIGTSSGLLTGVAGGTAIITYSLPTGCITTTSVYVNSIGPVMGGTNVCVGFNLGLTDITTGGSWSSANTRVTTIGSSNGLLTGISTGTSTITYNVPASGFVVMLVTVRPLPSAISGPASVCVGQTVVMNDPTPGGYWISATPTIASVNSSTGIVTGIAGGLTATLNYVIGSGCSISGTLTINALSAITGPASVCQGQSITLNDALSGGTWSSSAVGIATVGTSGNVTGIVAGSTTISYIMPGGCTSIYPVTVFLLGSISGPSSVCVGQSIILSDAGGGTWSSGSPTIATVGPTGIVTGIAGGLSATITYNLAGCKAIATIMVNALSVISGTFSICLGQTTTLTNATPGGSWSSGTTGIASIVSGTGVVTGTSAGTAIISYVLPSGCIATVSVTIANLGIISGGNTVCVGQTILLSDGVSGGTWSSGSPTIASVGAGTGVVTGIAGGLSANITYTLGSGCKTYTTVTVNALQPISGSATSVCTGQNSTLTDAASGGIWISGSTGLATIGSSTGTVTGIAAGTLTISYILPTGCTAVQTETVNPLAAIAGPNTVCVGKTIALSDLAPGGTWYSPSPTIASVSASGIVTGVAGGLSTTLSYTLSTGCRATLLMSVVALPTAPATIGGPSSVSVSGSPISLTDATGGGTWSSSNVAKATVVSGTGVVTGVSSGSVTITYTVTNGGGCTAYVTKNITVGPTPPAHNTTTSAFLNLNTGASSILTIPMPGGAWTCGECDGIIGLDTATGQVTGLAPGRATITYTITEPTGTTTMLNTVIVNALTETASSLTAANKSGDILLLPNPNSGGFTIKGSLATTNEADVTLEVMDMLGQVIYKGSATSRNGKLNEHIQLESTIANGMYILSLKAQSEISVFHFVVER